MASRRLSYQWRLFLPLVFLLWALIAGLIYFQFRREQAAKAEVLRSQLSFINSRVIAAYESDLDLLPFLRFISDKRVNVDDNVDDDVLDDLRLSVYNLTTGMPIYTIGAPLPPDAADDKSTDMFFKGAVTSKDGRIRSITAVPYSVSIADALKFEPDMWIVTFVIALLALIVAYLSTHFISRNIKLLRDFTYHAASDSPFMPEVKFPNDELGDISRQIITIYNKRSQAIKDKEYEHQVALKATREKARMKREMSNNINHELKTPIGIIKGYIDTILENPDMEPEQKEMFLRKSQANVDRLCAMLNDISTITRLEENGDHIPTEPIDFHDLIFTVADEIKESGALGSLNFIYDIPLDCVVTGNYNLLRGMILNLTKNAVLYSKGTEMGIKLVSAGDRFYTFTFWDNGQGVDEKHLPYLFDRFYRVDTGRSRKAGGTGLGLSIIKNTVVSLGGTISVKNRSEGGLEFNFTLPKAQNS